MSRTFGIEIEAYDASRGDVAAAIRNAGIHCICESYSHQTQSNWKVVTDASVPGGFEVVSPILQGEDGIQQVIKVMNAIALVGAKVNKKCGLHVHVGASDLTIPELKNIAKNYAFFEDFFDGIMPASRRCNNNRYIQSLRSRFGDYSHASAGRAHAAIDACTSIDQIVSVLNGGNRYHKLNFVSYWRHGTIEFRQHSGTVDAEKAVRWINLLMAFVDRAAKSRIRPRALKTLNVAASVVFSQFFQAFQIDAEQRAYFTARRIAFKTATEE